MESPAVTEQVNMFMAKYRKANTTGKGLDSAQWKAFFCEVMGGEGPRLCQVYFDGIDINDSKLIEEEEFRAFAVASILQDRTWTTKMAFRAFDTNRSKILSWDGLQRIGAFVGRQFDEAMITAKILEIATGLTHAQTLKLMTVHDTLPRGLALARPKSRSAWRRLSRGGEGSTTRTSLHGGLRGFVGSAAGWRSARGQSSPDWSVVEERRRCCQSLHGSLVTDDHPGGQNGGPRWTPTDSVPCTIGQLPTTKSNSYRRKVAIRNHHP
jgi:hypothetical protein